MNNKFYKKYKIVVWSAIALLILSFIVDLFSPGKYTVSGVVSSIENDINFKKYEFENFSTARNISALTEESADPKLHNAFINKSYFSFIYEGNQNNPILWNTQSVAPPTQVITSTATNYVTHLLNGWYIVEKKYLSIHNKVFQVIGLIPVKSDYYINNNYLHNSFAALNGIEDRFFISENKTDQSIKDREGHLLFYLGINHTNISSFNNIASIIFRITGVLLIFFLIQQYCRLLIPEKGILYAWTLLFIIVFLLRSLSYVIPFPLNFKQFDLFNPSIYGSGILLHTLGDLFINIFLFEWLVFFAKDDVLKLRIAKSSSFNKNLLKIILIALLMMLLTIGAGYILNTLVTDSQISFDVLNFFSLNIYTVIGFIILCAIATGYFFTMKMLLHFIKPVLKENLYLPLSVITVASLILLFFMTGKSFFVFYFLLLCWMILFLALLNFRTLAEFKTKIISSKVIFWIFFFSASITVILVYENSRKELESRKHYLENIAEKTDPSGERMMSITLAGLKNDYLTLIFERFKNKGDNYFLKDSLLHENFPGYLNRYETKIFTFDSSGASLYNTDSTSLNALNVVVETQSRPTLIPDLSIYDVSFEQFNYITRKIIKDSERKTKGYLFIISSPKRYKSDALYPQLFNKGNTDAIENSPLYSYAVYVNSHLINSYNDYPFPTRIPKEINFYSNFYERNINGYSELWLRTIGNKLVVITKPDNNQLEAITLFAYIFCSFLIGITLINLIVLFIKSNFNYTELKRNIHLTVRNQVHGTIILISLISFIIIGISTILFFINRYNKNEHEVLSRTINIIENDILNSTDSSINSNSNPSEQIKWKDNIAIQTAIDRLAEVHGSDINIYDLQGNLQVSTLPLPYNKGILSNLMDPEAFYHLKKVKDAQYFVTQKIGDLHYLNDYIPLRNKSGAELGYLNIPYFESQSKLYEEISSFLVTIINLNAFIFLIASIVAFFITNRITGSFSIISERMRAVNLGKTNELIVWNRKDEIGELVREYNTMVMKLEESAADLARNEREGAWREMARQVAHEIKNPLTPMKLNLQYLQMAIDNKSPHVVDISLYVTKILVEQIDHLSQIASDFSQFADINHSHNQKFDLNEILNKLYLLYAANNTITVEIKLNADEAFVYADKTQIQRLFTNLIQNAVQSIPEDRHPVIVIKNEINDKVIVTSVKDNGSGIPENMRSKIFIPNFTTKSSGTGLGLAMCKGIVEKIGGKIWFETSPDEGTTFYVELPLEG